MSTNLAAWNTTLLSTLYDYQAILREGSYACMYGSSDRIEKSFCVVNLNNLSMREQRCRLGLGDGLRVFQYPWIVTEKERALKVWDLRSHESEPSRTLQVLKGSTVGALSENSLVVFSTAMEGIQPNYISYYKDIKRDEPPSIVKDDRIDKNTAVLLRRDYLIYSTYFGCLTLTPVNDPSFPRNSSLVISPLEGLDAYFADLTTATYRKYEKNNITSLVAEGDRVVGSTEHAIKIWDVALKILQKEIPTDVPCHLVSLQGQFLIGVTERNPKEARIWDIFTEAVVYREAHKSPCYCPSFTLYNNTIYRIQ